MNGLRHERVNHLRSKMALQTEISSNYQSQLEKDSRERPTGIIKSQQVIFKKLFKIYL